MIPRFFCPTCKKFKNRLQVSRKTDYVRFYWYECRYCHDMVQDTKELLQGMMQITLDILDKYKKGEERKCTDCKWYGFTCECPVHCTQDTKIAWESATKEGGSE